MKANGRGGGVGERRQVRVVGEAREVCQRTDSLSKEFSLQLQTLLPETPV